MTQDISRTRRAGRPKAKPSAAKGNAAGLDMKPLEQHVGYLLRRAQLYVFDDFIRAFQPLNLRPATFSALVVIAANPGRSQREIASSLGIQRPNFVAMMDEFEERGLAERRPSPTDGRTYAVTLTPAGQRLLDEANVAIGGHEARMAQTFGEKGIQQLVEILGAPRD